MKLESPAFEAGHPIPQKYTCDGENVSPPFLIGGVPAGAQSLVLTVTDPDAPNGNWVHWTVWNIDPAVGEIVEGVAPQGSVEGMTSFGKPGYGGPCPPTGTHVYIFKLYAIDTMLPEDPTFDKQKIKDLMRGHVVGKTLLRGFYERAMPDNFI